MRMLRYVGKLPQNLSWVAGYDLAAALAAGVAALLTPAVDAVQMSVWTVVVGLSAQRPRRLDLRPDDAATAR